jgi:hypothetical protein
MGFALFVGLHPQPNSMGSLIHKACAAMLIIYAVARLCSRFDVCAKVGTHLLVYRCSLGHSLRSFVEVLELAT